MASTPQTPPVGTTETVMVRIGSRPSHGGPVLYSLAYACIASGLWTGRWPTHRRWVHRITDSIRGPWRRAVENHLAAREAAGGRSEIPEGFWTASSGVWIGTGRRLQTLSDEDIAGLQFCTDIRVCMAVSSRTTGDLYIGSRTPNLDYAYLFEQSLIIDAPGPRWPVAGTPEGDALLNGGRR